MAKIIDDSSGKSSIIVSGGLLIIFVALLFPFFQYYIDPDAVHYLTLVKRYLYNIEDYKYNGLWSPMGVWLTVLFVKLTHWQELFEAALIVNAIGALSLVMLTQYICNKYVLIRYNRWIFVLFNALFWSYAVYKQSFTDIWFYFFLTISFLIASDKELLKRPSKWLLLGILAAICFYSKSYALHFFPLMLFVLEVVKAYISHQRIPFKKIFLMIIVVLAIMWIFLAPWAYLLSKQYGFFTVSTTGSMCLSWFMYGTFIPKDAYAILQPPLDALSTNYFEDPWYVQDYFPQFYHSFQFFLKQVIRVGYNVIDFVLAANHISAFYLITLFLSIYLVLKRNVAVFSPSLMLVATLMIVFPIGFWLKGFELGRYIWITVPFSFIIMLVFYKDKIQDYLPKCLRPVGVFLIALSFIIGPVIDLKDVFKDGYTDHHNATILKAYQLSNVPFVCNKTPDDEMYQSIIRMAYMSENRWYQHIIPDMTNAVLIPEAKKFSVTHYFYFFDDVTSDYVPLNEYGIPLKEIEIVGLKGLKVFLIQ